MSEDSEIFLKEIAARIKQHQLGFLVLFLLSAHRPLRGLFDASLMTLKPILMLCLSPQSIAHLQWLLESPEHWIAFEEELQS